MGRYTPRLANGRRYMSRAEPSAGIIDLKTAAALGISNVRLSGELLDNWSQVCCGQRQWLGTLVKSFNPTAKSAFQVTIRRRERSWQQRMSVYSALSAAANPQTEATD